MNNVYHTEQNKQEIMSNSPRVIKAKSNNLPAFRNKLWLSRDNMFTLKRMDNKYLLAAIHIMENNNGKSFEKSNDAIAKLVDLRDELHYRKNLTDCLLKSGHIFDTFKRNQYKPCKMLGESKPSTFSTKGLKVI